MDRRVQRAVRDCVPVLVRGETVGIAPHGVFRCAQGPQLAQAFVCWGWVGMMAVVVGNVAGLCKPAALIN